jgi:hypothetical protein
MGKGCGTGERELEGLFQEETTKDHEVVAVAELRLHDRRSLYLRSVHEVCIVGFACLIVRVVVLQLLLPEGVDQIAFEIVRGMLNERSLVSFFPNLGATFPQGVETLLLRGLDD